MDGHMNKKELTHWMHMRKYRKYILYAELVYVFILLITLLYNFSLFMHLIVFQVLLFLLI